MRKQKTAVEKVIEEAKEIVEDVIENVEDATGRIAEDVKDITTKAGIKVKKISEDVREKIEEKKEEKLEKKKEGEVKKIFALYDISDIKISDPGLKNVINLDYKLLVKSHGRIRERYGKANVNIVERLINTLCVPGHRGKKHKIITKWASGKYNKNANVVLDAFKIIEEKTKKNPIQVLVSAVENGAPRDEVTMIQYGGARYPQAVDCAPLRRVSLALRNIVHGAYDKSFRSKKSIAQTLADELMVTSDNGSSVAVNKRTELEKQADAAR